MTPRLLYHALNVSPHVRFYSSPGLRRAPRLSDEVYAEAREAIPTWCLDGLVCGEDAAGRRVVVLVVRRDDEPSDGPFRGEPWVVGGRWDLVTPWEAFVVEKARKELFAGRGPAMTVGSPIANQLFATGWGGGTDGPFGRQGVTLQYCYALTLARPVDPATLQPDREHSSWKMLSAEDDLSTLHPYIRDVIELSGWLAKR